MEVPSLYDQGVHLQGEGMRHSRGGSFSIDIMSQNSN
jgi:hypothetical protein